MNAERKSAAETATAIEPNASLATVPLGLVVLMLLLLYWGAIYFDRHGGWFNPTVYSPYASVADLERYQPRSQEGAELARGKVVYENVCGLCHGNDGLGKPGQAPPFAGSEWVNTPGANRMIHVPLDGLSGPVEVKGQQWNLSMPAMGAALPDGDLAAVLTYIRQAWGNKGGPVTADQVKAVRAQLGSRTQPFSADELKSMPE